MTTAQEVISYICHQLKLYSGLKCIIKGKAVLSGCPFQSLRRFTEMLKELPLSSKLHFRKPMVKSGTLVLYMTFMYLHTQQIVRGNAKVF